MAPVENPYAASRIDRASLIRKDNQQLHQLLSAAETRILPLWHCKGLFEDRADGPGLTLIQAGPAWFDDRSGTDFLFLGLQDGTAWFAVDISPLEDPFTHPALVQNTATFRDVRSVGQHLPPDEANLCVYARGLATWHLRHRYCGACGSPTESAEGGHTRLCTNPECGMIHFPRTDPAVIMLVYDGDECLLARQPRFPPGVHSTLAGFVEPGESLEHAVKREVLEETSIHVMDVRYHSSQPWPFPSSLMLGFYARAVTREIHLADQELEHAFWISRADLANRKEDDSFRFPRPDSIARRLIRDWMDQDPGAS